MKRNALVATVALSAWFAFLQPACTSNSRGIVQTTRDAATDGLPRVGGALGGTPNTGGAPATGGTGMGGQPRSGGETTSSGGGRLDGGLATGGKVGSGGAITGGIPVGGAGGIAGGGAGGVATGGIPRDAAIDTVDLPSDPIDPVKPACPQIKNLADCDRRTDCHPVFVNQQNCACLALGCCMQFSACAIGGQAKCAGDAVCASSPPSCEGPYVVGYTGGCFEGCVRTSACANPDAGSPTVDAPGVVDTAADGPKLFACTNPGVCKANEIAIRINSLPNNQCACEPNTCGSSLPSCDCAADACTKYNATCFNYAPGSGYLNCTVR